MRTAECRREPIRRHAERARERSRIEQSVGLSSSRESARRGSGSLVHPILAGVVAAVTGTAGAIALLIAGLRAVGATPAEATSGLLVLFVLQGGLSIVLSLVTRLPLSFAWSTPGAALLVAAKATTGDYSAAIGAFLLSGVLLLVTGLWPWLARAMTRIPTPIASAMLAGILLPICLAPVQAAVELPAATLPVIAVWLVLSRIAPRWAVPAAVVATAIAIALTPEAGGGTGSAALTLAFVPPSFDPAVLISIGIPLYIVTMAGQNVPGFAVLRTFGYDRVPARAMLTAAGGATLVGAPFGGYALNLAAITAAITAGPDAHPDPRRRWVGPVSSGVVYLLFGLTAGAATALVTASPPVLITAVAGLALLGTFATSVAASLEEPRTRVVAAVTFLVVASRVAPAGIGSAFWGLVAGAIVMLALTAGRGRSYRRAHAEAEAGAEDAGTAAAGSEPRAGTGDAAGATPGENPRPGPGDRRMGRRSRPDDDR